MRWVRVMGARFAAITEGEAARTIVDAAITSRGHWTITANLDHIRRYSHEPLARHLIDRADLVVADGAPLVWASRLAGAPLPERIAGSNMIWSISEAASHRGASVFLLGGDPGVAERAAQVLRRHYVDLTVAGILCPPIGFEKDAQELDRIQREIAEAAPQIVFVGLGFPKQDVLIERLRRVHPQASFIGVGISFSFVAGEVSRAPTWTHRLGLEWLYRLIQEPRRLVHRYLVQGMPFILRLLASATWHRVHKQHGGTNWGLDANDQTDGATLTTESLRHTINHFGPDPSDVGGMSSVIRILTEHCVGGEAVEMSPTWRSDSALGSMRLTSVAALRIIKMRRGQVAHIHVSEKGSFIREGALVALARRRGLTTVVTIHGASFVPFARGHPRLVSMVLRHAHLVTCLDQDVLDLVSELAPGVQAEILPNPVPMDRSSRSADETDELVIFAGEIGHRKGADVLLNAWRLVAKSRVDARCIMVGPTKDFSVPKTERVEVLEAVNPLKMKELLRSARVVVLPSRAEGMPMILTEAMSGGRPFVSTPVGGIPELAREGGMLVAVDDEVGLAACLTELLTDPELARSIGERGRRYCLETRSVEVIDKRLRTLYIAASQVR
jgi:exopolysaccharide biosynthesis WecB/TagA/CpsF family protein